MHTHFHAPTTTPLRLTTFHTHSFKQTLRLFQRRSNMRYSLSYLAFILALTPTVIATPAGQGLQPRRGKDEPTDPNDRKSDRMPESPVKFDKNSNPVDRTPDRSPRFTSDKNKHKNPVDWTPDRIPKSTSGKKHNPQAAKKPETWPNVSGKDEKPRRESISIRRTSVYHGGDAKSGNYKGKSDIRISMSSSTESWPKWW